MKKTYISPSLFCVTLNTQSALLQNISVCNREISSTNAGLVKEENTYNSTVTDKSVWDNEW